MESSVSLCPSNVKPEVGLRISQAALPELTNLSVSQVCPPKTIQSTNSHFAGARKAKMLKKQEQMAATEMPKIFLKASFEVTDSALGPLRLASAHEVRMIGSIASWLLMTGSSWP